MKKLFWILFLSIATNIAWGAAMDMDKLSIFDIQSLAETRKLQSATEVNACMDRLSRLAADEQLSTVAYVYRVVGDNARDLELFKLAEEAYLQTRNLNMKLPPDERDSEFFENMELLGVKDYREGDIQRLLKESDSRSASAKVAVGEGGSKLRSGSSGESKLLEGKTERE